MGNKYSKGTTFTSDASNNFENLSGLTPYESFLVPVVDLEESTNNFDESLVIGVSGFGKVYRGVLRDGTKVALKRSNPESPQGIAEFETEIGTLSQLRHPYLVSLIGYCDEKNEMILVFEYMENGTLKRHLYGSDLPTLSWEQRLEICIGAARGLHYLHTNTVIHRDVKSANILLDENFEPKITNFGLSKKGPALDHTRVSTVVKGSFGYFDPEYFRRPAIDTSLPREQVSLVEWARNWQKKGQLEQIIDPNLVGKIRPKSLRKFGETAVKCLADYGVERPSMGEVLWKLEYALHLQESVIQDDPEENNSIPIGDQINYFSHVSEQSPRYSDVGSVIIFGGVSDLSGVDATSSAAQIKTSNWDDLSSDEVVSPR